MLQLHSSAIVTPGAKVGDFTSIWHFCRIRERAVIGENRNLGQNVYVGNEAVVGNSWRSGNSVSISSHVELGDLVFCAPFMVFTHISFPRAAVNHRAAFLKPIVQTGASLGENFMVVPVTVGRGTFLAAGSTLTKGSKDWSLMLGSPARQSGWVSAYRERLSLPTGSGEWMRKHSGDVYVLEDSILARQPGQNDILKYVFGEKQKRVQSEAKSICTPLVSGSDCGAGG